MNLAAEHIVDGLNTASQDLPGEYRTSLQQFKTAVLTTDSGHTDLTFIKTGPLFIPDIARPDLPDGTGPDQFFKILSGVGKHVIFHLTKVRQKSLSVKAFYPQLMEHEMIHRGI